MSKRPTTAPGPFHSSQLHSGDPYELSDGHAIRCMPTGGDGAKPNGLGFAVLGTDPAVEEAGVDPGYSFGGGRFLRAPDVGVGNVPAKPGWIEGVPQLALEYASIGQDEDELQQKITELLTYGTRFVWVVRLIGPRRVEVYERGQPMRTLTPGASLTAPGILQNEVRVEALYDPRAAHEATLRNLLQRGGYASLGEVREEGHGEGVLQGRREVLRMLAKFPFDAEDEARIDACTDRALLDRWIVRAPTARSRNDIFDSAE